MDWPFLFLMLVLKVPVIALLWLVWWAIREVDAGHGQPGPGDGGSGAPPAPRGPHRPRPGRRRPHGRPIPSSPPRVRAPRAPDRRRVG